MHMFIHLYIHVCMYRCGCIHVYIYVYVYIHMCDVYTCIHTNIHICSGKADEAVSFVGAGPSTYLCVCIRMFKCIRMLFFSSLTLCTPVLLAQVLQHIYVYVFVCL